MRPSGGQQLFAHRIYGEGGNLENGKQSCQSLPTVLGKRRESKNRRPIRPEKKFPAEEKGNERQLVLTNRQHPSEGGDLHHI